MVLSVWDGGIRIPTRGDSDVTPELHLLMEKY